MSFYLVPANKTIYFDSWYILFFIALSYILLHSDWNTWLAKSLQIKKNLRSQTGQKSSCKDSLYRHTDYLELVFSLFIQLNLLKKSKRELTQELRLVKDSMSILLLLSRHLMVWCWIRAQLSDVRFFFRILSWKSRTLQMVSVELHC